MNILKFDIITFPNRESLLTFQRRNLNVHYSLLQLLSYTFDTKNKSLVAW